MIKGYFSIFPRCNVLLFSEKTSKKSRTFGKKAHRKPLIPCLRPCLYAIFQGCDRYQRASNFCKYFGKHRVFIQTCSDLTVSQKVRIGLFPLKTCGYLGSEIVFAYFEFQAPGSRRACLEKIQILFLENFSVNPR